MYFNERQRMAKIRFVLSLIDHFSFKTFLNFNFAIENLNSFSSLSYFQKFKFMNKMYNML